MTRHPKLWPLERGPAAKRAGEEEVVKDLEEQIDRHVFRLYGLTPEEIALVRGAST
jgi:hypothetical protein